jgi:hypothetical protein
VSPVIIAISTFLLGVILGAVAGCLSEGFGEGIFAALALLVRPLVPMCLWHRHIRGINGSPVVLLGARSRLVRDGDKWVAIVSPQHGGGLGPLPLTLLPISLLRLAVRLWGHPLDVEYLGTPGKGSAVRALDVIPGLILARRRDEDLSYLKEHGRFPTFDLLTRRPVEA